MIEVVGSRPDQALKIDRRTYRVRETPRSVQADSLQLLRGLPAVTISPDDRVMLLGNPNVTLMTDGVPVRGDAVQFLRGLRGGDIERIEIITNPSAEYPAAGTGGIINFVLRKPTQDGTSGSASLEASSLGGLNGNASIKVRKGRWTLELQPQGRIGLQDRSRYEKLRTILDGPDGLVADRETGRGRSGGGFGMLDGKLSYDLDPRTTVSVELSEGLVRDSSRGSADFLGLTPNFRSFSQRQRNRTDVRFTTGSLALDHKGRKDGETLKGHVNLFGNPYANESTDIRTDDGGGLSVRTGNRNRFLESQVDWQHPLSGKRILSLGASDFREHSRRSYDFVGFAPGGAVQGAASDRFSGLQNTAAVYLTFQQPLGSLTVMPGFRLERFDRRVTSPGAPTVEVHRTSLFPSFHLDRALGKWWNLSLSYSRRIDRPSFDWVRPYVIINDLFNAQQGNPGLRDQINDNVEANFHYHRKSIDAGVIVYDRLTRRLWSVGYQTAPDGIVINQPVNSGHKTDRGAEFDVNLPLVKRVKANASVNLFDSRTPVVTPLGTIPVRIFRYTATSTLDWTGPDRRGRPGDSAQLQVDYQSPWRQYQLRYGSYLSLTTSYTHSLSKTLAVTAQLKNLGSLHNRHRLLAPDVQEDYDRRLPGPELRIKLAKTLGPAK
ncbi:TonB-dependent receptor [Sphingomonas ginkgonis]|nr:outer membrane beta-barrel family protein [Sphingomonas ginkgonis]